MTNDIKSRTYTMTHTETIIMNNDWSFKYDCIMKEYNIPSYAARDISYNVLTNETLMKFTWSTIEKGII